MKKLLLGVAFSTLMTASAFAGDIGVSMANSDTFLTVLRKGIEKAAGDASQPVVIEIADDDVNKQLSQVQNFIAAKVDAIIVNAVDTSATAPMTKLANDAGIPIVYVNRQPIDVDALGPKGAFVASNEVDSGTLRDQGSLPPAGRQGRHPRHGRRPCQPGGGAAHQGHPRRDRDARLRRAEDHRRADRSVGSGQGTGPDDQLDRRRPQARTPSSPTTTTWPSALSTP